MILLFSTYSILSTPNYNFCLRHGSRSRSRQSELAMISRRALLLFRFLNCSSPPHGIWRFRRWVLLLICLSLDPVLGLILISGLLSFLSLKQTQFCRALKFLCCGSQKIVISYSLSITKSFSILHFRVVADGAEAYGCIRKKLFAYFSVYQTNFSLSCLSLEAEVSAT